MLLFLVKIGVDILLGPPRGRCRLLDDLSRTCGDWDNWLELTSPTRLLSVEEVGGKNRGGESLKICGDLEVSEDPIRTHRNAV